MKALGRCRNNVVADNIVLIDVDTYNFNNVVVIDVPENQTKKRESCPSRTYICIDDDDESPSSHENVDSERHFKNGASSSRSPDRHFAQENNISPLKLSKGKRTYSGRGSNNCNGLNIRSDSDSSDDDSPDCEVMEDFSGKLREQWERASLKRKAYAHNTHEKKSEGESSVPNDNQRNQREDSLSDLDARDDVEVDRGKAVERDDHSQCNSVHIDENYEQIPCTIIQEENKMHKDEKYEEIPTTSIQEANEKNDLVNIPTIDAAPVENSIIDQREKLKETDEYKRALEEELSARKIALKIQAEEAQQLRRLQKRKRAESLRLLDMERRQKQRVEEIRETQKKDEENMNLKEEYRTEVRQELNKLEITCVDMASLLRGLGIQVGDGLCPSSNQVRAAYKRALLSFHPDRASGSDMRQQVEAEEKFKLISRMKEKLSL